MGVARGVVVDREGLVDTPLPLFLCELLLLPQAAHGCLIECGRGKLRTSVEVLRGRILVESIRRQSHIRLRLDAIGLHPCDEAMLNARHGGRSRAKRRTGLVRRIDHHLLLRLSRLVS